jgi:hypothetical protein
VTYLCLVQIEPWSRGDLLAAWALGLAVVGVIAGLYTLHRGNLNASVASMIPLNAEIREAWKRYLESYPTPDKLNDATPTQIRAFIRENDTQLEYLMNVLEIAAATSVEGTLIGVSNELMSGYVDRTLNSLLSDGYASVRIKGLLQDSQTFIYIRRFLNKQIPLSVIQVPTWYIVPKVSWFTRLRSFLRV